MRFVLMLLTFLVLDKACIASDNRYPVSDIPPDLLVNADFVVRLSLTEFDVKSLDNAVWSQHVVITILKESASERAIFEQYYDNFTRIRSIEGNMYDAGGRLLKKFKSDDIIDQSAVGDGSLYSDDRVRIIRPVSATYPFTVEFFVEYVSKRILNYPAWKPRYSFRESIESSRLIIKAADGLFPRIHSIRLPEDVIIEERTDGNEKSWEIRNLKAVEYEPLCPGIKSISPLVLTAPNVYSADGYTGDFSTWKGIGLWDASLLTGRDTLDKKYVDRIRSEVEAETDTLMKVKRIYRFMQKTCRYVNTNVGIGGWQPESANDVARLGYGDCKGLVNYTRALLKAFGINSIYTLILAGQNSGGIIKDFPSNQFNHVILAVPVRKDTLWLECTDPDQPFGYLGSFTDNREALLITTEGGILVRTPSYPGCVNTLRANILIRIDSLGNAEIERTSFFRGLQYEDVEDLLALNPEHLKEKAKELFSMPGLTMNSIKITSSGEKIPEACESLKVLVKNYATLTGGRMFIPLNRFMDEPGVLKKDPERKLDLVLSVPYTDYDTLVLNIPPGFSVESNPQSCNIKSQFGMMQSEMTVQGSTLRLYRKLEIEKGVYQASIFNDFVGFLQQISRQDKAKVVLIR